MIISAVLFVNLGVYLRKLLYVAHDKKKRQKVGGLGLVDDLRKMLYVTPVTLYGRI